MRQTVVLSAIAIVAVAAAVTSTASADERKFTFSGFNEIKASAGVDVVLKQGPFAIMAEGSEKAIERLEIEKSGDTLRIGRKSSSGWGLNSGRVTVTVTAPDYASIQASSGSDIEGEKLSLTDLKVEVSSGADIELSGKCANLRVDVSSGSDFDGADLKCETVTVSASSGADANVWASKSVHGDASSGADIDVFGQPETFEKDTSSGGSVSAR